MSRFAKGDKIGRYTVEQLVGHGGMGVVYKAYDDVLNRPVAIKLLAAHLGHDEQALARFQREATLANNLKHSHIALIYELGAHNDQPFIAMEWIAGETLADKLDKGRLSLERTLPILEQLADGVDYANKHGIIHRDLKPSNILIDDNDHVTIVDFGLMALEQSDSITLTGTVMGTPRYMSPEQLKGESLDGRSDQYSLALIAHQMLTGVTPYGEESTAPALIQQQLFVSLPPATEQNPSLPNYVDDVLQQALHKERESRFISSAEFARALAGEQVPSGATKLSRRPTLWPLGLLLLPVLVGVGWLLWRNSSTPDAEPTASAAALVEAVATSAADDEATADTDVVAAPVETATPDDTVEPDEPVEPTVAIEPTEPRPLDAPSWGEWSTLHGDFQQSRYAGGGVYPLNPEPSWTFSAESDLLPGPIISQRSMYIASADQAYKIDIDNGLSAKVLTGTVGYLNHAAVVSVNDNYGAIWTTAADGLVTGDDFYRDVNNMPETAIEGDITAAVISDAKGNLYIGTDSGTIHVYSTVEQAFVATHRFDEEVRFTGEPMTSESGTFFASDDGLITAVGASEGSVFWTSSVDGPLSSNMMLSTTWLRVVVGTENSELLGLSLQGEIVWRLQLASPVIGMTATWDRLYAVTEGGELIIADGITGEQFDSVTLPALPAAGPILNDRFVMLVLQDGQVVYFNHHTEQFDETFAVTLPIDIDDVAAVGGWLFVQSAESVYAFAPE